MTAPTHDCPGCDAPDIANDLMACEPCWQRLPADIRYDIRAAHLVDPVAFRQAAAQGYAWFRDDRQAHGPRREEPTA